MGYDQQNVNAWGDSIAESKFGQIWDIEILKTNGN